MTQTLESLMRAILDFAEEWKRCGHLQHEKLPTWTALESALESALAALVQPQKPMAWRIRWAADRATQWWDFAKHPPTDVDLTADESRGTFEYAYAAPVAQVERGEPATFNPLTCQLSASDFPGPKQREEWEAAPAAQEVRSAAFAQVICAACGPVGLTEEEYDRQLMRPDARWRCPKCRQCAEFDDAHFEAAHLGRMMPDLLSPPTAQEARPACDNRGGSYHVDGDPIARGEAPEPVAQPDHWHFGSINPYALAEGISRVYRTMLAGQPAQHKEQE